MSRQIQIRRGTAAQHTNFIGAIGEVTMDTDTKTLRVHDGSTPGGIVLARADQIPTSTPEYEMPSNYDFVVASNVTATSWYRKYKSGWIEQGGTISLPNEMTVYLPVIMKDDQYYSCACIADSGPISNAANGVLQIHSRSVGSFKILRGGAQTRQISWEAKGMAAA